MCFHTYVSQSNILSVVLRFALIYGSRFLRLFLFRETKLADNGAKCVCVYVWKEMLRFYPLKESVSFFLKELLKHLDQGFLKCLNRLLKQKEVNFSSDYVTAKFGMQIDRNSLWIWVSLKLSN